MSCRLHFDRPEQSRNQRAVDGQIQNAYRQQLSAFVITSPKTTRQLICILCALLLFPLSLLASNLNTGNQQAIASAHPLATQAGMSILNNGGNAFDAAIAVASVLAVVEPYSSGFGGGGFWLIYDAKHDKHIFIDGRETAPGKAHPKLYQAKPDKSSDNTSGKTSINGPLAAGIPGQAAALAHLAQNYGTLPLKRSLADAIHYAEQGFPVDEVYRKLAGYRLKAMQSNKTTSRLFLQNDDIPELGHPIVQTALANTLKRLADHGHRGFYQGPTALHLVENMRHHGGIWTLEDLANYSVIERQPIQFDYQGHTFITAPPPSAGGIALAQMFGMLSHLQFPKQASVEQTQLLIEVMRRAYRDRAEFLGDPQFTDIPDNLTQADYIKALTDNISYQKATPSNQLKAVLPPNQGTDTTHYSILDQHGNRVSATLSINLPFGSAYTDPDTGLLLNNEMDDFSKQPGVPNSYGLIATKANEVQAGKRPLSSMTPTFIENEDTIAILGTPGGSRIITMVFLGALEHLNNAPVKQWVSKPRFHHQYLPDVIQHEPNTFAEAEKEQLRKFGYELKSVGRTYGNMQAILWNRKERNVFAASDPRRIGSALVSP